MRERELNDRLCVVGDISGMLCVRVSLHSSMRRGKNERDEIQAEGLSKQNKMKLKLKSSAV